MNFHWRQTISWVGWSINEKNIKAKSFHHVRLSFIHPSICHSFSFIYNTQKKKKFSIKRFWTFYSLQFTNPWIKISQFMFHFCVHLTLHQLNCIAQEPMNFDAISVFAFDFPGKFCVNINFQLKMHRSIQTS